MSRHTEGWDKGKNYMNIFNAHNLIAEFLVLFSECQIHEQNQRRNLPFKLM